MKTASLMGFAIAFAIMAPLTLPACNKKDDDAPLPASTAAAVAPPVTSAAPHLPVPPIPPPAAPPPAARTGAGAGSPNAAVAHPVLTLRDGGVREAAVAAATFDASTIAFPTALPALPTLQPSALPAIASGIVGGIVGALPSGLIPPPPAPAK